MLKFHNSKTASMTPFVPPELLLSKELLLEEESLY